MYTLSNNARVSTLGGLPPSVLRDLSEDELARYFEKGYEIFLARLSKFQMEKHLSESEERELRFMLEALLAAKHLLVHKEEL